MRSLVALSALLLALMAAACRGPAGETVEDKRSYAQQMRSQALADLYARQPEAKEHVENAPGYAVFSNIGSKIFLLATGNGFGVVENNKTGESTYMRMFEAGGGVGLGLKTYRAVYVFNSEEALAEFVTHGWQAGGDADVTLKHEDDGADASLSLTTDELTKPVTVYQFTDSGVALSAVATGTKFYKDDELN